MERMPGHVAQILYKDTKRLAHLLHWIQTFYLTFPKETIFKPPKAPESFGKTYFQMKVNKLGRCLVPGRIPLGGIFAATARLGARLSCYLHILFTSHTWQNSHVGALRLWKNLCSWKNHKQKKVFVKKQAQIRKDKISAQPYTTLCIQFLDRENKNNTLPLGKQIVLQKYGTVRKFYRRKSTILLRIGKNHWWKLLDWRSSTLASRFRTKKSLLNQNLSYIKLRPRFPFIYVSTSLATKTLTIASSRKFESCLLILCLAS